MGRATQFAVAASMMAAGSADIDVEREDQATTGVSWETPCRLKEALLKSFMMCAFEPLTSRHESLHDGHDIPECRVR